MKSWIIETALFEGWTTTEAGLPEMTVPPQASPPWEATKGPWRIKVTWNGALAEFNCMVSKEGALLDCHTVVYPHEVMDWLQRWISHATQP